MIALGRVVGQVHNQQIPAGVQESLSQWPTDDPYSVIASKELGLCETMLGKEFPSTLTSMNNLAAVLKDRGNYEEAERDVFTLRLLWASLNAFPCCQWTSPAPIRRKVMVRGHAKVLL